MSPPLIPPYLPEFITVSTTVTDCSQVILTGHFIPDPGGNFSEPPVDPIISQIEIEVTNKNGTVFYSATYDSMAGTFSYPFVPDFNDIYTFRARGITSLSFSTPFSVPITITVNVAAPSVAFVVTDLLSYYPSYGMILAIPNTTYDFSYTVSPNCFGTKTVEYSIDGSDYQGFVTSQLTLTALSEGVHNLLLRTTSNDGQTSTDAALLFYVGLTVNVTFDPIPSLVCGGDRILPISGTKDPSTDIIEIKGVVAGSVKMPTTTSWQADVYLVGSEVQTVEITARNFAGRTATIVQQINVRTRLPLLSLNYIDPTNYSGKVFLEGFKDVNTSVQISLNNGAWVVIVPTDTALTFSYLLDLVAGENQIQLRSIESSCNLVSSIVTTSINYLAASITQGAFVINDGAFYTQQTNVVLSIEGDNIKTLKVSNFADFREQISIPYAPRISWFLLDAPGIKRVYVKFLDVGGNESIVYTDEILLGASEVIDVFPKESHRISSLNAIDIHSGHHFGTMIEVKDLKNGNYQVGVYSTIERRYLEKTPEAIAITNKIGLQTLILSDTGSGTYLVQGTIEIVISEYSDDKWFEYRNDNLSITTGESLVPIVYEISEDPDYYYASTLLPFYETRFYAEVMELVAPTTLKISKEFELVGQLDGYGENLFIQDGKRLQTKLIQKLATLPLTGSRIWYPTLAKYAMIIGITEASSYYLIDIDTAITDFRTLFSCRLEFTRQKKLFTDYKIKKVDGLVEFINESSYATGNIKVDYSYNKENKGRPDTNWLKLSGLHINDLITVDIPQAQNKVTFNQINKIRIRFYNGDEGLAPASLRFTLNNSFVFDGVRSVTSGVPSGYGYGYGYGGKGDQIVEFTTTDVLPADIVLEDLKVEFRSLSNAVYIGEIEILSTVIPIDCACRILVNGDVVYQSKEGVTNQHDSYELRFENKQVDVWFNGKFVSNVLVPEFDENNVIRFIKAGGRTVGDKISAVVQSANEAKYYNENPIQIQRTGRFVAIEPNVRKDNG